MLLALTIGDKQQLGDWWQDLARMGIVHLLVISGLHVGLIAVVGALLGKLLVRLLLVLWHLGGRFGLGLYRSPDLSSLAPLMGWCAAAGYSLLAGFSLPTQRALIAVTVVVVARLAYRKLAPVACFFVGAVADCAESAPCRSQRRVLAVIFSRWDSCGLV